MQIANFCHGLTLFALTVGAFALLTLGHCLRIPGGEKQYLKLRHFCTFYGFKTQEQYYLT
jgi:hypothetical protein